MKRNTERFLKALFTSLLSLLGFSSCETVTREEYGTPWSDFKAEGFVSDQSGKPLEGVRTIISSYVDYTGEDRLILPRDTVYTDAKGEFSLEQERHYAPDHVTITYEAEGFKTDSTASIVPTQTKPGKSWYEGEYTVTDSKVLRKSE